MTKENAKNFIPLVQALADGKTIQKNNGGVWEDLEIVAFEAPSRYYRIKPEPRRWWLVWEGCQSQPLVYRDFPPPEHPNRDIVEVVEVMK